MQKGIGRAKTKTNRIADAAGYVVLPEATNKFKIRILVQDLSSKTAFLEVILITATFHNSASCLRITTHFALRTLFPCLLKTTSTEKTGPN